MKKSIFLIVPSLFILFLFPQTALAIADNVVVIGWDGVQRNHFWECYNKELPECANGLPNIEKLSGGIIFDSTITNGATCTKPGWAQILSGYNAEVMGIYDNSNYRPLPEGYSVFEKLENYFGKDNIVTLFIAGKYSHVGGDCPGDGSEEKGQPWCLTKKNLDYWQNKLGANENVGNKALELLETYGDKRFFAFFHFKEPDSTGHSYGENSSQYSEKIIDDDLWLGKIVRKLKNLGIYNQTFIYVITDHGFDEGKDTHRNAPFGFMASNDSSIIRSGDRKDLAPTILKKYGLSLEQEGNIPAVDGHPLDSLYFGLSPSWNQITWLVISDWTTKIALENIDFNCGAETGLAIARKRKDFWQVYVAGFGGINFNLQNNRNYFINVSENCDWTP